MRFPKRLIALYLATTGGVLILSHTVLYLAAIAFFPGLMPYRGPFLAILLLLGLSFNAAWILDYKFENELTRWYYILAACWQPLWTYLLMATTLACVTYLIIPDVPLQTCAVIFLSLAVLINIYGIINARVIRIKKLELKLNNLPEFWKNKTVVLASDLHLGHVLRTGTTKKITDKIQSLKPDVVFIPGDFFDGAYGDFISLASPLKNLQVPLGIYFCSGNHDVYAGLKECEQALKQAGVQILDNQKIEIQGLQIAGLAYEANLNPNIKEKLAQLNIDKNKPSILLKHVPSQIQEVAAAGFNLQLSGHSHRGQVWPISLITKKVWKNFDYGLKNWERMLIYTSSGVGTWGPPVRIFTQSEIVVINFI